MAHETLGPPAAGPHHHHHCHSIHFTSTARRRGEPGCLRAAATARRRGVCWREREGRRRAATGVPPPRRMRPPAMANRRRHLSPPETPGSRKTRDEENFTALFFFPLLVSPYSIPTLPLSLKFSTKKKKTSFIPFFSSLALDSLLFVGCNSNKIKEEKKIDPQMRRRCVRAPIS